MTKLLYISPSIFPSSAANTTHVILQVDGFTRCYDSIRVVGMANPAEKKRNGILDKLRNSYGVDLANVELSLCANYLGFANNLVIAFFSVWFLLFSRDSKVITRNIYAAFFTVLLRSDTFIYETHKVEVGFRSVIQRIILRSNNSKVVVISKALKRLIIGKYGVDERKLSVLHDAARAGLPFLDKENLMVSPDSGQYECIVGYFGSLLPGRGIELIETMAHQLKNFQFLIFGPPGQNSEFEKRVNFQGSNIVFGGFLSHKEVHEQMARCNILVMPYQERVSISDNTDTSKYMSPMKMFEYMASGTPIVSSDLPVLQEVLSNKFNCLLVSPSDADAWVNALVTLRRDREFALNLASNARLQYLEIYNWDARAVLLSKILESK